MRRHLILLAALLLSVAANAQPAEVIIARHAEKADRYALCPMGTERSQALAAQYLGRGAAKSFFRPGARPEAMLAITVHTAETIAPAADSWNLPVITYGVFPAIGGTREADEEENGRTQAAATDVLTNPGYAGKTLVMIWEHKHIANAKLEKKYPNMQVTLRQLLHLDGLSAVPKTWPEETYDYFWIVNYAPARDVPISFRMVREVFAAPFNDLPANPWGRREPLHIKAGCLE
jgi:hypothetical protein